MSINISGNPVCMFRQIEAFGKYQEGIHNVASIEGIVTEDQCTIPVTFEKKIDLNPERKEMIEELESLNTEIHLEKGIFYCIKINFGVFPRTDIDLTIKNQTIQEGDPYTFPLVKKVHLIFFSSEFTEEIKELSTMTYQEMRKHFPYAEEYQQENKVLPSNDDQSKRKEM